MGKIIEGHKKEITPIERMILSMRKNTLRCLSILFFMIFAGCGRQPYKDTAFFMGTFVEVSSVNPQAKEIVFNEFQRIEKICNLYDKNSEVARLNEKGDLEVSKELFELLKKAQMFYRATDGAFDVTVGPEVLLWKKAFKAQRLPSESEVAENLSCIGFDNIYLDEKNLRVKLLKAGMRIDLGGIAKGYAVDCSIAKLKGAGVVSVIVNAGGDLYCLGENRHHAWRVGIRDPRGPKRIFEVIDVMNKAVATSGDYEQFFIFQNKRYSHIINPKTGYPAESGIISATVIAQDALTADALATAFIVLGFKKSSHIINNFQGIEAKLITDSGHMLNLSSNV